MGKKKALFVINTLGHAGAEVAMLELLRRLAGEDISLTVYVLMEQGELAEELPKGVKLYNRSYCPESVLSQKGQWHLRRKVLSASCSHASLLRNAPYLVSNGLRMLQNGRILPDKLLWRVISDGSKIPDTEYDLAVSFLEGGAAYFVADHVRAKKKAAFIHIDYRLAGYTRALDRDCYLAFDRIFPVSDEVREHFLEVYPECTDRTFVFHNLINAERIRARSREGKGFDDGFKGFRILTVGRLVPQKGYDLAVSAMKLLKEAHVPVRWYALGEGPLRRELEKQIAQLGLAEDFILAGARDNPYPYFAQADLYVNLSRFEGKSIAIQEAQILGVPVVASDSSGNREQVTDGVDGVLCSHRLEDIRDQIRYLLEHKELRQEYAARALGRTAEDGAQIRMLTEMLGTWEARVEAPGEGSQGRQHSCDGQRLRRR